MTVGGRNDVTGRPVSCDDVCKQSTFPPAEERSSSSRADSRDDAGYLDHIRPADEAGNHYYLALLRD